jgi:hypothetical protein
VLTETNERKLFLMYQSLRETVDKLAGGKGEAPFSLVLPSGAKVKVKSLDEASMYGKEASTKR